MSNLKARGELVEALRLSRGLTQQDVTSATGISQATLSKVESGTAEIDADRWDLLSDLLGVPAAAFDDVKDSVAPAQVFHRKRKTTPQTAMKRVRAELALARLRVKDLVGARETTLRRHDLDDGFVTPQEVALLVRDELEVGRDPIADLVELLETAGAVVLRWPLESIQVDAISSWESGKVPMILVGEHVPADRQRFTMAHELGHAVLHESDASEEQEREADAFAGEFLVPAEALRKEWPSAATVDTLLPLKRRWGISLAALVRRGYDIGLLDDREFRAWMINLSTTGMHRREPDPTARENPTVVTSAITAALESGTSMDVLASRAYMYPREFELTFLEESA